MKSDEKPAWVVERERYEGAEQKKVDILQKLDELLGELLSLEPKHAVAMALNSARLGVRVALDLLANDDQRKAVEDLWNRETSSTSKPG
jgi:hypothetical protein